MALLCLANRPNAGPPARIREIAESHAIPERYLVQILLRLKGAGLVESVRGASGGYRLARGADRISLAEVLEAIDGPPTSSRSTEDRLTQVLQDVWERVRDAELLVLRRTSLAELLDQSRTHEWVI
jgi:Rrf2 family protein